MTLADILEIKEFITNMRKLSESIWSDIQDRSSGEIERKEDDANNLDIEGLGQYIIDHYRIADGDIFYKDAHGTCIGLSIFYLKLANDDLLLEYFFNNDYNEMVELAHQNKDEVVKSFMSYLDRKIHDAKDMLIERFNHIASQPSSSASFMYDNKTIIFLSDDETMLYKYTDYLIVMKNKKVIAEGKPLDIFKKVSYLKKNSIEIPEIVEITVLAKNKKGINIDYHKDVRDIIKDIYKHV